MVVMLAIPITNPPKRAPMTERKPSSEPTFAKAAKLADKAAKLAENEPDEREAIRVLAQGLAMFIRVSAGQAGKLGKRPLTGRPPKSS